jgi:hypothetical protein
MKIKAYKIRMAIGKKIIMNTEKKEEINGRITRSAFVLGIKNFITVGWGRGWAFVLGINNFFTTSLEGG